MFHLCLRIPAEIQKVAAKTEKNYKAESSGKKLPGALKQALKNAGRLVKWFLLLITSVWTNKSESESIFKFSVNDEIQYQADASEKKDHGKESHFFIEQVMAI